MGNHALEEIINEERNIQVRVELEKRKAADWFELEKERVSQKTEERLVAVRDECRKLRVRAESEAKRELAEKVRKAEEYQLYLRSLPDRVLATYIRKYLPRIMPEGNP